MQNKSELKRELKPIRYTIKKTENGYIVDIPQHRGLVLSGGGAKGIAYAGMINAMYERGFIRELTHVSGASAGAITASFIAIGLNNDNISKLMREMNVVNLLHTESGWFQFRAKGERFQNILEIIYALQIKEHLNHVDKTSSKKAREVYERLTQKISRYAEALKQQNIVVDSVEDIIALSKSIEMLEKLDKAFGNLPKTINDPIPSEAAKISFHEMAQLREVMPKDKQHLIKMLTVVATNQSQKKLEIYSENNENLNDSIAEKVQHSSAHPLLFVSAVNRKGEYIADGGILDNMPIAPMLENGLQREEILCVGIESGSSIQSRISKATFNAPEEVSTFSSGIDYVAKPVFGGELFQQLTQTTNCEKIFHHIGNMLFLDVGDISTVSMKPSENQKEKAIANGYRQTNEWLDSLNKAFDNPLIAMLYLRLDRLDDRLQNEAIDNELFTSAAHCKQITLIQEKMVQEMYSNKFFDIFIYLKDIEEILRVKAKLNKVQIDQALALCLKQVDHYTRGNLEKFVRQQSVLETNACQISWIKYIWDLLMSAIEWILSGCLVQPPKNPTNNCQDSVDNGARKDSAQPSKLTALSVMRLFEYKEAKIFEKDQCVTDRITLDLKN